MLSLQAHTRLAEGLLLLNGVEVARTGGGEDDLRGIYNALGLDYPKFHKMDRYGKLALLAVEPLFAKLKDEGADVQNTVGIITVNRSASLATDIEHWEPIARKEPASPAVFVYTLPNTGAGEITIRHKVFGPSICLAAEVPDADLLLTIAEGMLRDEAMRHVIMGRADIFAAPYSAGFALLGTGAGTPLTPDGLRAILTTAPWTEKN